MFRTNVSQSIDYSFILLYWIDYVSITVLPQPATFLSILTISTLLSSLSSYIRYYPAH